MTSYKHITADITSQDKLTAILEVNAILLKVAEASDNDRALLLQRAGAKIKEHDLMADLGLKKKSSATTTPGVPKYKNPISNQTWSGRGYAPIWIKGKDRTQFLIDMPTELSS